MAAMDDLWTALGDLDARYDGPPPAGTAEAVLLGGRARRERMRAGAESRLHERLARAARLGIARRRAGLRTPEAARSDAWLARLVRTLVAHRMAALHISQS